MSKKNSGLAQRGLRLLGKLILVALSLAIIFALSNLLGQALLRESQPGSKNATHFAYLDWFNHFFPTTPHWFPRGGGGVSLIHGQPILGYVVTVIVERLVDLSLIQAYRLINFLVYPLTAFGIYLLGWNATRSQTVGLISAIFYLLAPASWVYLTESGSIPNSVAMIFLPLALTCLTGFIAHNLTRSEGGRRRVWLVGLILSLVGVILSDRIVGAAAILLAILYSFLTSLLQRRDRRGADLIRVTWGLLVAGAILLLILVSTLVPQFRYNNLSGIADLDPLISNSLPLPSVLQFLGFAPLEIQEGALNFHFPIIVTIPLLIGALLSFINAREARALYIIVAFAIAWFFIPQLQMFVSKSSVVMQTLLSSQAWLQMLLVLIPIGGAWGVYSCATTILNPKSILNRGHSIREEGGGSTKNRWSTVSVLSIVLAGGLVAFVPAGSGVGLNTGSELTGSVLRRLVSMEWPRFEISDLPLPYAEAERLATYLPEESLLRIDVSHNLEDFGGELLAVSDASQIYIDHGELSLIQSGWEYQRNVFYSRDLGVAEFGNVESINNAAQYYGTKYIFLDSRQDRVDLYGAAGWELVHDDGGVQLWSYPDSMDLVSFSSKPAILITEKPGRNNYRTIFRLANDGLLPYREAYLVKGQERIDFYTLDDLKSFDALFLTGYEYRNSSKAWETLTAYVEQGGSLFIDTGWQFAVAEWEFESAPDVLPIDRLTWTDYGMPEEYDLGSIEIVKDIDVTQFKPLVWEGKPWALSGADLANVRAWGRIALSANDRPLIVAGEYGEGRVVWSGMNLINHALYMGENEAELDLLHNLLNWLLKGEEGADLLQPVIERDNPDQIIFSLEAAPNDKSWLYWREAHYPNWHAYLHDDTGEREIPIFRCGPGFMLMPIETSSDKVAVTLRWELSFIESTSIVVSIMGVIFLVGIAIDGLFLDGQGLTWVKIAFTMRLPRPFLDEETHREAQKKPLRVKDILPEFQKDASVIGDEALDPNTFEDSLNNEQEALLKSWLDDQNDDDDPWVNKILDSDQRK
jgi:hypothetical protein